MHHTRVNSKEVTARIWLVFVGFSALSPIGKKCRNERAGFGKQ